MTSMRDDAIRREAADWVVRLGRATVGEADWVAFDAWLEASPAHKAAYDDAIGTWSSVSRHASRFNAAQAERRASPASRLWIAGSGIAAALVVLGVLGVRGAERLDRPTVYQTAKAERRVIRLSDGTRIDLNAGSTLTVRLTRHERRVEMGDAEAVFDVAHESDRPFVVVAGDREIKVLGTRFDVRNRGGEQSVAVARGVVAVRPLASAPGDAFRLTAGTRLDHVAGEAASKVSTAGGEDALAWTSGAAVYHDRTVADVAADLSHYASRPVRPADPATARLKFSGVLRLDEGDRAVEDLTRVAPLSLTVTPEALLLRAR